LIPKFQGLGREGLKFGGLGLKGLGGLGLGGLGGLGHEGLGGLEFESLVLDPFVSDSRLDLEGSGLEIFLGFDLGW
jgi:hypothetical protein